jgi:hypothetical protein
VIDHDPSLGWSLGRVLLDSHLLHTLYYQLPLLRRLYVACLIPVPRSGTANQATSCSFSLSPVPPPTSGVKAVLLTRSNIRPRHYRVKRLSAAPRRLHLPLPTPPSEVKAVSLTRSNIRPSSLSSRVVGCTPKLHFPLNPPPTFRQPTPFTSEVKAVLLTRSNIRQSLSSRVCRLHPRSFTFLSTLHLPTSQPTDPHLLLDTPPNFNNFKKGFCSTTSFRDRFQSS